MSFIEQRINELVETVSLETIGGRQFNTTVVTTASGKESRNANWSQSRGQWDFGDRIVTQAELDTLIDFFEDVEGKAVGFRFKDWSDYRCPSAKGLLVNISGGTYQMHKKYGSSRSKKITKPCAGAVVLSDGIAVVGAAVNVATGVVTMPPGFEPGDVLSWGGEFDLPARFDTDQLQSRFEAIDQDTGEAMHYLMALPVIELKI